MTARAAFPLLFGIVATLGGQTLKAQTVTLDEGVFRLRVGGQEVGTETFNIRQNGSGESAVVIAVGKVVIDTARGGQEINAQLSMKGPALQTSAYQVTIEGANASKISGMVVGGRFSARIMSGAGEQMREYMASEGAVVTDDGLAHHYYFLAQRLGSESARVPVLVPRQSKQFSATVTSRGSEAVSVGGGTVQGRHLVVSTAGFPERHVWVDDKGRVLRMEVPDQKFLAERIAAPK
jgi:hypothetical protein